MFRIGKSLKKYSNSTTLLLLLLISVILLMLNSSRYDISPKKIGTSFFSIFQIAASKSSSFISNTINSIDELKQLKTEHDILLGKMEDYQRRERDFIELKEENLRLREQLNLKETSVYKFESARVIAHEPGNIFNSFVIDKGSRMGIEKNMPVIAYQNGFQGLVGKVIEVSMFTSRIIPIIDNTSFVAARLLDSRYEGLVNGDPDSENSLIMNYVSKNAIKLIQEGDLVISSGFQSIYPSGIYIGRIRGIDVPEWQTSLVINIDPIIDFSKLEYLLVLTGEKLSNE